MKRNLYCVTLAFLFILPGIVGAQSFISFYYTGSSPRGALAKAEYGSGNGFAMEFLSNQVYKKQRFEIKIGAGFEFLSYGLSKKVDDLVFNTPGNYKGYMRFKNNMNAFYLTPRFTFNLGKVSPYLEILGAIRGFNTWQESTFNGEVAGYEKTTRDDVFKNKIWQYGASAGLMVTITRGVLLDLRMGYSYGGGIHFIKLSSVKHHPNYQAAMSYQGTTNHETRSPVIYEKAYSSFSDVFMFKIGVVFKIQDGDCETCSYTFVPTGRKKSKAKTPPADDNNDTDYQYNDYDNNSQPDLKPAEAKPIPVPAPTPEN